jgi:hypothetical protein
MRLHTPLHRWAALFLATLGCVPLTGCGGREESDEDAPAGGSAGSDSDGGAGAAGGGGAGGQGGGVIITGGTGGTTTSGGTGGFGRPLLIDGTPRQASACPNDEWLRPTATLETEHLDATLRLRLSQAWTEVALLEHGSIAAFARFTLHLLALGAPASLIESSNAALADETAHAKLAFSVASAYADRAIGPGALSLEGALDAASLRDVVVAAIHEGCVGETVSAIQAAEARQYVTHPALRAVLTTIAVDETRHAQLAWRFVQWALKRDGEDLARVVRSEFMRLRADVDRAPAPASLDARELELLAGGVVPERLGAQLRAESVRRVILPCAEALLVRPRVDVAHGASTQEAGV